MGIIDRFMDYLEARPELTDKLVGLMDARIDRQERAAAQNEPLRTTAQLRAQARAQSRAPPKDPAQAAQLARILVAQEGYSQRAAALEVGLPESTLRAYLKKLAQAEEGKLLSPREPSGD